MNELTPGECDIIGRVHEIRIKGKRLGFLVLSDEENTIQAVTEQPEILANLTYETVIKVEGLLVEAHVRGCSVSNFEIQIKNLIVISESQILPTRPEENRDLSTSLEFRYLDLRSVNNQIIFRLQSLICQSFREFLYQHDFTEIHTPKLTSSAHESGASVFKVQYFEKNAYLAQSPQLYKQMAINSGFNQVFEVGPVFRAENSNTYRHLTEFTGLDLEMRIKNSYHEIIDFLYKLLLYIFQQIENQYPLLPKLNYPKQPLIIPFCEALSLLEGATELGTTEERELGKIIKEKYGTDIFIIDRYPKVERPFYTMISQENSDETYSYDIILRGNEILSGAQRINNPQELEHRAAEAGIQLETIRPYLESFKYGSYPHGGGGFGLERLVMFYLDIDNIRKTSMFPRDPKRLEP